MKVFISLFMLATIPIAACAGCSTLLGDKESPSKSVSWLQPDSLAYSQLGKNLYTILFSSNKVECFQLNYCDNPKKEDVVVEENIVRGKSLGVLSADQLAILRFVLFSPAGSYRNDSIRVRAPYDPILEFVFKHKKMKQSASVIISLSDLTWTVLYDDKRQFNYNFTNKETILRFCSLFLFDEKNKNHK